LRIREHCEDWVTSRDMFNKKVRVHAVFFRTSVISFVKAAEETRHIIIFNDNKSVPMALKPFGFVCFINLSLNGETGNWR
jgi:hypothetical protein